MSNDVNYFFVDLWDESFSHKNAPHLSLAGRIESIPINIVEIYYTNAAMNKKPDPGCALALLRPIVSVFVCVSLEMRRSVDEHYLVFSL